MNYIKTREISKEQVQNLYSANGWKSYADNMDRTMGAIKKALFVFTCWDDDKLVGLIRAVGDGETITYVQDILVLPDYHRRGIGTKLLKQCLHEYKDCYQFVLITDDTQKTNSFYKSMGLKSGKEMNANCFIKMNY